MCCVKSEAECHVLCEVIRGRMSCVVVCVSVHFGTFR